jgi:outer membrane protein assembly factor BamB
MRIHPLTSPTAAVLIALLSLLNGLSTAASEAPEWPQFRGPNSSGVARGKEPPSNFGPGKNELWTLPLESGHSSPCIAGDSLFLTTYDEESQQLEVVCIARSLGKVRWRRAVPSQKIETGHPSFSPASSSPATDGERVVAYFGSFGLICFDLEGNQLWEHPMPLTKSYAGNATSPVIYDDLVVLYRGNRVDHFLLAVDKETGKQRWRVEQGEHFTDEMACTACPIRRDDQLLVHSARSVQAYNLLDGERLWVTKCATTATSTPILVGDEVLVAAWNKMGEPVLRPPFPNYDELLSQHDTNGNRTISQNEFPRLWIFHRPLGAEAPQNGATVRFRRADRDGSGELTEPEWQRQLEELAQFRARYKSHGLLAINTQAKGIVQEDSLRTLATRGIPEVPSPISDGQLIYLIKNGGLLSGINLKTGKREYQIRTGARGTHYASPIIAGDKLFATAGDGTVTVISLGPKPQILARNKMGDAVYATPAVADGKLYVRTHSSLSAFGESE